MQESKRRYVAKAVSCADGWIAEYAMPGTAPRYVTRDHVARGQGRGADRVFDTAADAEHAARGALIDALNNRPSETSKPERYRLMTGAEFADAVRAARLTPTFFCFLWGCAMSRFFQWTDEVPDKSGRVLGPPHGVRLLLETWRQFPATIDLAESLTERFTTERKPRRAQAAE